jgi:ribosome-associated translation inhibitor RaiA
MALSVEIHHRGSTLEPIEQRRIERQLRSLERRMANFPDPRAELALAPAAQQRLVRVDLRVALGPHGGHLVSHQEAETADLATKRAVDDVKRQLERRLSSMRGEAAYGVPSRRLPSDLRPNPPGETEPADLDSAVEDDELREADEWPTS